MNWLAVVNVSRTPLEIYHTAVVTKFACDFETTICVIGVVMVDERNFGDGLAKRQAAHEKEQHRSL